MPSMVSPVMVGAEAASPQPTTPSSVSSRTSALLALRTSSNDILTGLIIGSLTEMGSIYLILIRKTDGPVLKHRLGAVPGPGPEGRSYTRAASGLQRGPVLDRSGGSWSELAHFFDDRCHALVVGVKEL